MEEIQNISNPSAVCNTCGSSFTLSYNHLNALRKHMY